MSASERFSNKHQTILLTSKEPEAKIRKPQYSRRLLDWDYMKGKCIHR